MRIGKIIKEKRLEHNLTQEDLASKLHVTRQAVSSWETGKTMPDIEFIRQLANLFSISVDEMLLIEVKSTKRSTKRNGLFIIGIVLSIIVSWWFVISYLTFADSLAEYEHSCMGSNSSVIVNELHYGTYEVIYQENINVVYEFGQYCIPIVINTITNNRDSSDISSSRVTVPNEFDHILKDIHVSIDLGGVSEQSGVFSSIIDGARVEYTIDINYAKRDKLYTYRYTS